MSERVNLMSPEVFANPHPIYAELRRQPVCQVDPGGMWAITRYDDVVNVFKHPNVTSAGWSKMFHPDWLPRSPLAHSMLSMDPPQHTKLRGLVNAAFAGPSVTRMEARIQTMADILAEQVVSAREVDYMSSFALALPAHVAGSLLGIPTYLHPHLKHWGDDLASVVFGQLSSEQKIRVETSIALMERYIRELIAARRKTAGDDLISDLVRAEVEGQRLSDEELVSFGFLLVFAGVETTITLLGQCMLYLSERPELVSQVCAERGRLIPNFVEEMLRYEPPVSPLIRWTSGPVELGGVEIPPGSPLLLVLSSAARDEKYFPEPDEFRLDRAHSVNIVFGHGPHFCLGYMLARLEARLGLQAILQRVKSIRRQPGEISFQPGGSRCPIALPLIFEPK